mmetsp:Transcript_35628/g.78311  ORF Transcript_35628/g.78311 Transcript_35628/m.78311 type:complete len:243 (-) Transcript_35628:114-842(-)
MKPRPTASYRRRARPSYAARGYAPSSEMHPPFGAHSPLTRCQDPSPTRRRGTASTRETVAPRFYRCACGQRLTAKLPCGSYAVTMQPWCHRFAALFERRCASGIQSGCSQSAVLSRRLHASAALRRADEGSQFAPARIQGEHVVSLPHKVQRCNSPSDYAFTDINPGMVRQQQLPIPETSDLARCHLQGREASFVQAACPTFDVGPRVHRYITQSLASYDRAKDARLLEWRGLHAKLRTARS